MINLTQFPIYIDDDQRKAFGGQNVWRDMNLIPLKHGFSMTSFYNILMTIPLGFGLPFIVKVSLKKVMYIGLVAGLLFEMGQLLTALYAGYTFRFVDVDDVIFNFLGTLIGYLILFKLFKAIVESFITKFSLKSNSMINHIRNT
ncbi:VanZ family protein [Priestia sp. AB]|uniref:VanZ family protein n=1 Tax=Priestia sp. AB TaxID=3020890 RepID=UPI00232E9895|nr:VanZ family protein [Priestia sp. AB]MDC0705842.1 VanZ family protein [Priestia sp. AB]